MATAGDWIQKVFNPENFGYWIFVFVTVIVFTFFYTVVVFQQQNLAENLQRQGGFVPGIRPGRPTEQYINRVLIRITWAGAFFLGSVAVAPFVFSTLVGTSDSGSRSTAFGITSAGMIIVVGVVLDTLRQIEAQLMMRQYEGFIR
jgi:preprotein translocase subunit SecY